MSVMPVPLCSCTRYCDMRRDAAAREGATKRHPDVDLATEKKVQKIRTEVLLLDLDHFKSNVCTCLIVWKKRIYSLLMSNLLFVMRMPGESWAQVLWWPAHAAWCPGQAAKLHLPLSSYAQCSHCQLRIKAWDQTILLYDATLVMFSLSLLTPLTSHGVVVISQSPVLYPVK